MTTTDETPESSAAPADGERGDLLDALRTQRYLFLHTVDGLTEEQARQRPTVSELSLGGLVKHVTAMESQWCDFIERGQAGLQPEDGQDWLDGFQLTPEETLDAVTERFHQAADRTDALVEGLPDLGASQPLPEAPWFAPGATRSARRVFTHLVAEIAQHAGHADILRESIDGQRTMA